MTMNNGNVTPKDAATTQNGANAETPEDLSQMTKGHTGMKILVVVMGVAILALTFMIAMKVMALLSGDEPQDKLAASEKSGAPTVMAQKMPGENKVASEKNMPGEKKLSGSTAAQPSVMTGQSYAPHVTVSQPAGATLIESRLSGDVLMLRYQLKSGGQHIQLLHMISGEIISRIDLSRQ